MDDNGWFVTALIFVSWIFSTTYEKVHQYHYTVKFIIAIGLFITCYTRVQQPRSQHTLLLGLIALGSLVYAADIGIRHLFAWLNDRRSPRRQTASRTARYTRSPT